jgi:CoA-substrate-specific enzyme activase, putative
MMHYFCKYTPIELFAGFGEGYAVLDGMQDNFDLSDNVAHANLCGFGKSVIQAALNGEAAELLLVNCCDTMRRVYDILKENGCCRFIGMLDLPHKGGCCEKEAFAGSLARLKSDYGSYSGKIFDRKAFLSAFHRQQEESGPYVGILGVRAGYEIQEMIEEMLSLPVRNMTCVGGRNLPADMNKMGNAGDEAELMLLYAEALLSQLPCRRMNETGARRSLYEDPNLKGVIYHTIKFCDFYGFEYAEIKDKIAVPMVKLETDYTRQSKGQLGTRIEAFSETLGNPLKRERKKMNSDDINFVAGIDSGSTSTDVVILDQNKNMVASVIIPTGGGAQASAEASLKEALDLAGIDRSSVSKVVTTGYGRSYIDGSDESITEITCHARGASHLNPEVRTIIDIGGQDSKVIRIDETGAVKNFIMNDKCAAGTGRFLEMMARTLGLPLSEMSRMGLKWDEEIVISSMCTVFAESEVVSLVAQNKSVSDIIHGLNNSVAAKVSALAARIGQSETYMMTGGVAKNAGVVQALEAKLGIELYICDEAQLCGALGAALFALEL